MKQSFSRKASSHSANQEIPHLLWSPKVHYHVNKGPPLVPIMSQTHPIHNFLPYFLKIHSNIVREMKFHTHTKQQVKLWF